MKVKLQKVIFTLNPQKIRCHIVKNITKLVQAIHFRKMRNESNSLQKPIPIRITNI